MRLFAMCAIVAMTSIYGVDFGKTDPNSQDRNGNQIGPCAPWDSNGVTSGGWDSFDDCCMINDHYAMPEPEKI